MADVKLNEILRGNEYDGVVLIGPRRFELGTNVKTTDIGHSVDPSRLPSINSVNPGSRGQILLLRTTK